MGCREGAREGASMQMSDFALYDAIRALTRLTLLVSPYLEGYLYVHWQIMSKWLVAALASTFLFAAVQSAEA